MNKVSYIITNRGFKITSNGYILGPCFTFETGEESINNLIKILEPHADKLESLARAVDEKIKWNVENYPNGKNWPEFSAFEKYFKKLQKEANIKDT